jgi:hypothetical protein
VRYLRTSGLPWMYAHQAVRSNNGDAADVFWHHSLAWFRMTKKHNYQEEVVLYMCIRARMRLEVQQAWRHMRTLSLSGGEGRNVPWDLAVEKLNLSVVKMTTPVGPTRANVQNIITKLNGIRHVESELLRAALRTSSPADGKDSDITDNDVNQVVRFFKDRIGKYFEEVCSQVPNKLGKKNSDAVINSWEKVQKPENLEAWVRRAAQQIF